MINWLVDTLSEIIQVLIFVTIAGVAWLAAEFMPDAWLSVFNVTPSPGLKAVAGGVGSFLVLVLLLGPHLILLDMRNAIRAIEIQQHLILRAIEIQQR